MYIRAEITIDLLLFDAPGGIREEFRDVESLRLIIAWKQDNEKLKKYWQWGLVSKILLIFKEPSEFPLAIGLLLLFIWM